MMADRVFEKWKAFCEWQARPTQIIKKSTEHHRCHTCGEEYQGNYCPQCGQSAKIGRYSFKNALLLFLDVWGVGNRGMFRTLRDLILRPGYMIRDYILGMQMAYFPPFKMFFLLCALSLLINSGMNIKGMNRLAHQEEEVVEIGQKVVKKLDIELSEKQKKKADGELDNQLTAEKKERKDRIDKELERMENEFEEWTDSHESYVMLLMLLLYSWPLWLLIRHCPTIPDLRFSESLVAMVYIINMLTIYSMIPSFLCFSMRSDLIFTIATAMLMIIPVKQLSGYSYWQAIWRTLVALIPFIALMLVLTGVVLAVMMLYAAIISH